MCGAYHPFAVFDAFNGAWNYIKTVSTVTEENLRWKPRCGKYSENFQELTLLMEKMVDVYIEYDIYKYQLRWVEYYPES